MKLFQAVCTVIVLVVVGYFVYQHFNPKTEQHEIEDQLRQELERTKAERDSISIRQAIIEEGVKADEEELSKLDGRLSGIQRSIRDLAKRGVVSGGNADSTVRDLYRSTTLGFSKWERLDSIITYGNHTRDSIERAASRQLDSIRSRARLSTNEERKPEIQLPDSLRTREGEDR